MVVFQGRRREESGPEGAAAMSRSGGCIGKPPIAVLAIKPVTGPLTIKSI